MPSLFHAFNFRTAKRRGLAPTLLLVSLHPLIYRRDYILIHALASGGGSGLYIVLLAFRHPNSNFVQLFKVFN